MAILTWDDSFCVGIEGVDEQHRNLVEMINRLDAAVSAGRDEMEINEILKGALDYTQYHFATEERLMEEAGRPANCRRRSVSPGSSTRCS